MRDFDLYDLEYEAANFIPMPTGDKFLDDRYKWQMTKNAVEWPYYRFFYYLSKKLRPRLTVELGGWRGTAAAHFAAGWPNGYVLTIDHHSDPGDEINERYMMEAVEQYRNLYYLQGWSNDELAKSQMNKHARGDIESALPKVEQYLEFADKIDILFIDSWHHYEYAKQDWETYKPMMASPGLVICDDIIEDDDPNDPICGMMQFWLEMPEPKFLNSNLNPTDNRIKMAFIKV